MEATHLQSTFVCLFAILLRLAFPATFSLLVSEQPLINADALFISCIFPEMAISASWFSAGSEERAVLVETELTLFLLRWWSAFFPLSTIFILRNFFFHWNSQPNYFSALRPLTSDYERVWSQIYKFFLSNVFFFLLNCSSSCKSQYLW